ncbi:cupin domain [Kribbella orskensis]|uniref:Cupin domain n=1 Tax=Kribbella orskensis TaxID=2512216 RepID=A0ABY2BHQ9_9ACTN|nr:MULTISPECIES: cupin domain-containing protein [Kribbella]TCN38403.1 cupin domain [Kribbella sp. VKM Ac-2500]TCO20067.1 cupin domain [Kribbella orskensis]
MQVIHAVDAPRFQLPGVEFTGLAAPSRGSRQLCTWRLAVDPGVRNDEPHTIDRDEVFMVLAGSVQITPDGEKLGPGDALVVQAGEPIQLSNLGETTAELYIAITAGFTGTMANGTQIQPPWAQ